jgi:hypothetical protein
MYTVRASQQGRTQTEPLIAKIDQMQRVPFPSEFSLAHREGRAYADTPPVCV